MGWSRRSLGTLHYVLAPGDNCAAVPGAGDGRTKAWAPPRSVTRTTYKGVGTDWAGGICGGVTEKEGPLRARCHGDGNDTSKQRVPCGKACPGVVREKSHVIYQSVAGYKFER